MSITLIVCLTSAFVAIVSAVTQHMIYRKVARFRDAYNRSIEQAASDPSLSNVRYLLPEELISIRKVCETRLRESPTNAHADCWTLNLALIRTIAAVIMDREDWR